jgi:hypothetical protein
MDNAFGSSPLPGTKPQSDRSAAHEGGIRKDRGNHAMNGLGIGSINKKCSIAAILGNIVTFEYAHGGIGNRMPQDIIQRVEMLKIGGPVEKMHFYLLCRRTLLRIFSCAEQLRNQTHPSPLTAGAPDRELNFTDWTTLN